MRRAFRIFRLYSHNPKFISSYCNVSIGSTKIKRVVALFSVFGGTYILLNRKSFILHAAQAVQNEEQVPSKKTGFRDRRVMQYENRIKQYSTPDKIFRYFATVSIRTDNVDEIFMTPSDFIRSITPDVIQPENLGLDKFKKFNPQVDKLVNEKELENSVFMQMGEHGLISFSDYVFLLTILSSAPKNLKIAFKELDLNGDGEIEYAEFERVASVIRQTVSVGQRHRDHAVTGSVISKVSSGLYDYFFGPKRDKKLTFQQFLAFQNRLHKDVLRMEFNRFNPVNDRISEKNFAKLLLMYTTQSTGLKSRMIKRVKEAFTSEDEESRGISFNEAWDFWRMIHQIDQLGTAIGIWTINGASLDKEIFKHIAYIILEENLSDYVIDVIFVLFDNDGDGMLSYKEFFTLMKKRISRGLDKPRDTGFTRMITACGYCMKTTQFFTSILDSLGFRK